MLAIVSFKYDNPRSLEFYCLTSIRINEAHTHVGESVADSQFPSQWLGSPLRETSNW
jgi:hypothetical protein